MGDRKLKSELFDQLARVGKALGNGKRLELLDLLAQGERRVEVLAQRANLGLTTASAHLQVLKQAGLVSTRRNGTKIYYNLAGNDVAVLYDQLRTVAASHVDDVEKARDAYLGVDWRSMQESGEELQQDELLQRVARGEVTVLDVRPEEEYESAHIPGAVSIPVDQLAERLQEIPPNQEIVAYCRGAYCVLAYDAVEMLNRHGHKARRLQDGMLEWRLAGKPTEQHSAA